MGSKQSCYNNYYSVFGSGFHNQFQYWDGSSRLVEERNEHVGYTALPSANRSWSTAAVIQGISLVTFAAHLRTQGTVATSVPLRCCLSFFLIYP